MLRIGPAALLLVTSVAATSCHKGDGRIPIRVTLAGSLANMSYLPHSLAQQLGYYDSKGLNVSVEAVPGGTKAMQALLGGSTDVVVGFYDHTVRVSSQGQSVRAFVVLTRFPGNVVMVSPATHKNI